MKGIALQVGQHGTQVFRDIIFFLYFKSSSFIALTNNSFLFVNVAGLVWRYAYHLDAYHVFYLIVKIYKIMRITYFRLRPSYVDVRLLAYTHELLQSLEAETGIDPGYIVNGGLFVASSKLSSHYY